MIDDEKIKQLEDLVFSHISKKAAAAERVAGILGVMIDIKPATVVGMRKNSDDYIITDEFVKKFKDLLRGLGLEYLIDIHNSPETWMDFYISKKMNLARELRDEFVRLWGMKIPRSEKLNSPEWVETNRKIGELLGYPETAISYFVSNVGITDPVRVALTHKYRFYAHSPEGEDVEFATYDLPIYEAILKYAPQSARFYESETEKRWIN